MPFKLPTLAVCFFSLLLPYIGQSQTLVNTTGSTISNPDYIIEYSVGEIAVTTLSGSANTVTQGLLQPSLKIANPSCAIINDDLQFFPNPTMDRSGSWAGRIGSAVT